MKTIEIKWERIERAVEMLCEQAPARGDFWGVPLRARYATTNPRDVLAMYHRIVRESGLRYGGNLSASQRARMVCGKCGARGCKMWREYQTCADYTDILCGPCALAAQKKTGTIDADGRIHDENCGPCDQIGWMVPAVPTTDGGTFWGYTSVPADGCAWWRALPSYPSSARGCAS